MTDDMLIFSGWNDHWYLLMLLLLVIVVVVIFDFLKKDQFRRVYRLLSYLLISASLTGLLLKIKYRSVVVGDSIILLTKGYNQGILDSLMKSNADVKIYSLFLTDDEPFQKVRDVYDLKYQNNNFGYISLLGEGLNDYELKELESYSLNFYPAVIPEGVVDIQFDRTIEVEKPATIKGTISRRGESKIILSLNDSNLDSMLVNTQGGFSFTISPKVSGRFVYQIKEYIGDSLVGDYPLPMVVVPQQKSKIFIVNDYPIFDTKYLRGHLVKRGHQVIIRNRYSLQNFNYEYYNTNDKSAIGLASDQLKQVDILFIDHQSLLSLTSKELRNVSLMVKGYGLTVLLQNVQKFTNLSRFKLFDGMYIEESNEVEFVIQKGISITKNQFRVSESAIPITSKLSLNLLGGYKYSGIGKVGILSFQNSYELVLNGYQELYGSLWSDIMEQLTKRREKELNLDFEDEFPIVNSPLIVNFKNNTDKKYQVKVDGVELALKQDSQLPNRWTGKFWTGKSGWHILTADSTIYSNYEYVFSTDDWSSIIGNRKVSNTQLFAKREQAEVKEFEKFTYREISPMIFYLIFLISVAYLWIETKL